jgi:hypothetical protein
MSILLSPPLAFLIYLVLVGIIAGFGRLLAGAAHETPYKSTTYASGEAPPTLSAVPGYRPFFKIALFFAVLHLGVLVMGSGGLTLITGVYLVGLVVALVVLMIE